MSQESNTICKEVYFVFHSFLLLPLSLGLLAIWPLNETHKLKTKVGNEEKYVNKTTEHDYTYSCKNASKH